MSDKMPVAVVTGAAQGIGKAIAEALLTTGYKVSISDIQEEKARHLVESLRTKHGSENVTFFLCDTSKESDYKDMLEFTLKEFKSIDVLINNAGIAMEEDPKLTVDVNLMGPINGCRTGLEYMSKSKGGNGGIIINTASLLGFIPCAALPVYSATKHAVIGLTRSYGQPFHFIEHGVMFMAFSPTFADTQILKDIITKSLIQGLDVTKRPDMMSPEYVAQGVMKLLEDKINGATLFISSQGGYQYIGIPPGFDEFYLEGKNENEELK